MTDVHDLGQALSRLDRVLPSGAPWLADALRPPADGASIQALRDAVTPWSLPEDLVTYLRWHDGQDIGWWPLLEGGPLLSVERMIHHFVDFRATGFMGPWPPGWLPLTHEQWYATAIELTDARPAVLIDVSVDGPELAAPSLAAMLHATADLATAGKLIAQADGPAPGGETRAYNDVLDRAKSSRYDGAWEQWHAVVTEHGPWPGLHQAQLPWYRSIGWADESWVLRQGGDAS